MNYWFKEFLKGAGLAMLGVGLLVLVCMLLMGCPQLNARRDIPEVSWRFP